MKIISKHKDYYDHLVGYYGYDENIVYDRRNNPPFESIGSCKHDVGHRLFHICGKKYPIVKKSIPDLGNYMIIADYNDDKISGRSLRDIGDQLFISEHKGESTSLNVKYRQPVIMEVECYGYKKYTIPELKEYGFSSFISADDMYQRIYNFLSWLKDNPEPPNNQTDKEKIISHGFDVKKSFRPNSKK